MRVALADDSALFRSGLARLLGELGIDVVAECVTAQDLVDRLDRTADADAVILDIRMPPTFTDEGIRAAAAIRAAHPRLGVLVLSTYVEGAYAQQLLAAGTSHLGYLLKDRVDDPGAIRDALERLSAGGSVIDPEVVERLVMANQHQTALDRLTERERAVLAAMAEGRSNAGIGQQLFLSRKTVEAHIASIFVKLDMPAEGDVNRRVRAVLRWLSVDPTRP